jgi:hypothetical protein
MRSALATWLVLVAVSPAGADGAQPMANAGPQATCGVGSLPGLFAQLRRVSRETGLDPLTARSAAITPSQVGRIADFWQIALAVLGTGEPALAGATPPDTESVALPSMDELPCGPAVRGRDHVAWSMGLVGYSAREIADVLNGHLTRADLDEALSRSMAGEPRARIAAFLESRWREPAIAAAAPAPALPVSDAAPTELDAEIVALARTHHVEPALVRAIIAVESAGNPRAVSSAGAIGLMQLMPRTAAALGVDPWKPLENLRGGIAYLAGLLRAYEENVRLALIAYNAGPQHADLVRSGRAVAYRETRKYVDAIAARYPIP